MRRNDEEMFKKLSKSDNSCKGGDDDDNDGVLVLSKEKTLRVVRGLMALLLNMDFTCNVDLFLVTCKVSLTVCKFKRFIHKE
jgi:baculoviral IAP repeat-containing protein 6